MKSRLLFRENGHVIRTRSRVPGFVWPLLACAGLVGLLAWGQHVDDAAEQQDAVANAYQAGRTVGHLEMAQVVADAYLTGQRDAVAGEPPCTDGQPERGLLREASAASLGDRGPL